MSSEVTTDGQVIPRLNILAPVPLLNLRGFHWSTVDKKIPGPPPEQGHEEDAIQGQSLAAQPHSKIQALLNADAATPIHRAVAAPPPPALQVPRLPQEVAGLPSQLDGQLGHVPGKPASALPKFPLAQFSGAYAGNGFNMIWRPRSNDDTSIFKIKPSGVDDNILELNLTTEQLTFGATIGDIPNRGLKGEKDITLAGLPYLQTVQDVTNTESGLGDSQDPVDIHFETGMWLYVPKASFHTQDSVVRMASIPHGTTVNAQGVVPARADTALGGAPVRPTFDEINTTPFTIGDPSPTGRQVKSFKDPMGATVQNTFRLPQDLTKFNDKTTGTIKGTKLITTDIIKNPNLVLKNAIENQKITETITFEVSTGPPAAGLSGGGTSNISFLLGKDATAATATASAQNNNPVAHAATMTSRFWIETVAYTVVVPPVTRKTTMLLRPDMSKSPTAPTPQFAITTLPGGVPVQKEIIVPGIQIQSSQTVNLNFATLTWPHVSVATLVPTGPQPFDMT